MFRTAHLTSLISSSVVSVGAVCAFALVVSAQERDRSKVSDKYKWNLTDLYASDEAWRAAKDKLVAEIAKLTAFKGTLGTSPARLADALELGQRLSKEFQKVVRLRQPDVGHRTRASAGTRACSRRCSSSARSFGARPRSSSRRS